MISRFTPSTVERGSEAFSGETVERASRQFRVDGALILEDIVDTALIVKARIAFGQAYARYLDGNKHEDALPLGDRRLQITVDLESPFDDPRLFANPWILPILSALLDEDFVLGSCVVACSLSSAPKQSRHLDGGLLFPHTVIDRILPASAITVAFPLLEMNDVQGTTALWLGSHRSVDHAVDEASIEPIVHEGSCVLWDYRLHHRGTPNRSKMPRPLLTLSYCRPWWLDHKNFRRQEPIRASKRSLSALPERYRKLLARAQPYQADR
jgi:ectoine hydroxylase-related dioxygenase (phytanoyl-CoA dioxygenase family)